MRLAAYQAPLAATRGLDALPLIAQRVSECEAAGVEVLLCPEAILGGLADDADDPFAIALQVGNGDLAEALRPLSSRSVTTILGFTELDGGRLYNAAAVYSAGRVVSVYRKRHPARRTSVYTPGVVSEVMVIGGCRAGIAICNDTNFPDLPQSLAAQGAQALFVPSNNALRPERADVLELTRDVDVANARRFGLAVVRADVAGDLDGRTALGSSAIIDADGVVLRAARLRSEDLLIADVNLA